MTWIIFDNVHVWKLIHVCSFYYFPDSRRSCHSCRIWNSIAYFPDFMIRYGLKNLWMGCIKQILTAVLFGEWYKIIVPSIKFNLYLLFTSALRPFPHEQSIFVYYSMRSNSNSLSVHDYQMGYSISNPYPLMEEFGKKCTTRECKFSNALEDVS